MSTKGIKTAIVSMLSEIGEGLTFVNLSKIKGFEGEDKLVLGDKNIFLWVGVSKNAITALDQLAADDIIDIVGTSELVYIADGGGLEYPLAKSIRKYKSPRWLPSVINKGRMFAAHIDK